MDNQEQKITDISIYIAGLQATYRPAPDARHTTHWFSTDEVYTQTSGSFGQYYEGATLPGNDCCRLQVPKPSGSIRMRFSLDASGA